MIDWTRVTELQNEFGKSDFDEIVEIFLEEVEQLIKKLGNDADRSNLRNDLHFLKGSALNLGFSNLAILCQAGETEASQGQADSVDLSAIIQSYNKSKKVFQDGLVS